jgi:glyoxylase-like metal-dependent hydrolase (beta-lactamase superfamily II)
MTPPVVGRIVCHVLLCELPDRLVLVDTGFGTADVADPAGRLGPARRLLRARLASAETAVRQVEALGFAAGDVRDVVLTHFDLDHVGGLADFPEATVHVLADEWDAATRPRARERQRYRPVQWAHGPKVRTYSADGEPWEGRPAARELDGLGADFALVPMAGHTRGHAVVAVRSDAHGWLCMPGTPTSTAPPSAIRASAAPPPGSG